jgi:CBS-domain-containing membrane protein
MKAVRMRNDSKPIDDQRMIIAQVSVAGLDKEAMPGFLAMVLITWLKTLPPEEVRGRFETAIAAVRTDSEKYKNVKMSNATSKHVVEMAEVAALSGEKFLQ